MKKWATRSKCRAAERVDRNISLMLSSERPKPSQGKRRRIFDGNELEQTIGAADEPYRTLFTVAARPVPDFRSCSV